METDPYPSPASRLARRLAGAAMLGLLAFAVLWLTLLNAMSAAIVSACIGGGAIMASTSSDVFGGLLEAMLDVVTGLFSAIGELLTSLFSFD